MKTVWHRPERVRMTLPFDLSLRSYQLPVYLADDWIAVSGVNEGNPLAKAQDMVLGDCYTLRNFVTPQLLDIAACPNSTLTLRGTRAKPIKLSYDATLTLMSDEGHMFEALVFVAGPYFTGSTRVYMYPLGEKNVVKAPYCLIGMQKEDRFTAIAKATSVSISRHIPPSRNIPRKVRKTLRKMI